MWDKPPETPAELDQRLRELITIWQRRMKENEDIYGDRNPVAMTFYMCAPELGDALDGDTWGDPPEVLR